MTYGKVRTAKFIGVVSHQPEAASMAVRPGDTVLVERGVPRALVVRCPDGCGDLVTVNLDGRAGPAWRLYLQNDSLTLFPSVWRDTGCRAHFILWDNAIYWTNEHWSRRRDPAFETDVLEALKSTPRNYAEIAVELGAIPWAVLDACRNLVDDGKAIEGTHKARGRFSRAWGN